MLQSLNCTLLDVSDMPDVLKSSSLALYAIASKCFKTIKTMSDVCDLQGDFNLCCVWSSSNEMYLQPTKCHNLRISRKKNSLPRVYKLNNTELKLVTKKKTLDLQSRKTSHGMNISPKLSLRQTTTGLY